MKVISLFFTLLAMLVVGFMLGYSSSARECRENEKTLIGLIHKYEGITKTNEETIESLFRSVDAYKAIISGGDQ